MIKIYFFILVIVILPGQVFSKTSDFSIGTEVKCRGYLIKKEQKYHYVISGPVLGIDQDEYQVMGLSPILKDKIIHIIKKKSCILTTDVFVKKPSKRIRSKLIKKKYALNEITKEKEDIIPQKKQVLIEPTVEAPIEIIKVSKVAQAPMIPIIKQKKLVKKTTTKSDKRTENFTRWNHFKYLLTDWGVL